MEKVAWAYPPLPASQVAPPFLLNLSTVYQVIYMVYQLSPMVYQLSSMVYQLSSMVYQLTTTKIYENMRKSANIVIEKT